MNFAESMRKETNRGAARTANGALSYGETMSGVLDFFSKSGALRGQTSEVLRYFDKAIAEDTTLALKALFYMRDIRGGQGERDNFREILKYLAKNFPLEIERNIKHIPEFGRWDDLYAFDGTVLFDTALELMKVQFMEDLKSLKAGRQVSLLAKWLKSENASSKETKRLAEKTRIYFGLCSEKYRKSLSKLRSQIKIVETKMSQNNWSFIEYSKVPSQAARIYSEAFRKHDPVGYEKFIEDVKNGKEKINASTLYPYDIVRKIMEKGNYSSSTYDALWNALPNYIESEENAIAVVDTSGSMYMEKNNSVSPIAVAVSLGIYFAERMTGKFHDYFLTFSSEPRMQKIQGTTIEAKVGNLQNAEWGMNTDLMKTFRVLLNTSIKERVPENEMPTKLFIISDMQFDTAVNQSVWSNSNVEETNFEAIEREYNRAGYKRPDLVFWNVNASSDTPVTKDENGTFLVSGCSPSILKYAVNCEAVTPHQLMLEILNSERYSCIS